MLDDLVQPCQKRLKQTSNKKVHPRKVQGGDFVPKMVLSFQLDSRGKWTPNYEGSCTMTFTTTDGSKDKVTASGRAQSTWGIQLSKDLRFEASADQRLGTWAFKVVRENSGYCVQCTLPITFTIFPKFSKIRGAMSLAGVGEGYINILLENGYTPEENRAKHYGKDLCLEQDAVTVQKYKKKIKAR
ncbi:hypothetical protein MTR_3g436950 [Medicago truncatula]|uniref:Uncharacterized protein n=1 Tax=Medicago truncatula TaxID=3880 RepID=A0A072UWG9_MEDTR|nr:hypothetical protein MTR_3g436950 [Medicago truncatula]